MPINTRSGSMHGLRRSLLICFAVVPMIATLGGCRTSGSKEQGTVQNPLPVSKPKPKPSPPQKQTRTSHPVRVLNLICLYDQKPWISADVSGDRDPEGLQYRVFLNAGGNKGVLVDGTMHIEMYKIGKDEKGAQTRTLVSDWHYPTSDFTPVSAKLTGLGYLVQLRWAKKNIAGSEVEIITQFEDPEGNITRGATKRLRVPKYSN